MTGTQLDSLINFVFLFNKNLGGFASSDLAASNPIGKKEFI